MDSLAAWTAANGFTSAEVDNLRDYASRVLEGRQFRLASGFDYPYGPQALKRWRERAGE